MDLTRYGSLELIRNSCLIIPQNLYDGSDSLKKSFLCLISFVAANNFKATLALIRIESLFCHLIILVFARTHAGKGV